MKDVNTFMSRWNTICSITMVVMLAMVGCRGEDRPTPTPPKPEPTPTPKPTPKPEELNVTFNLSNGGVIREGELTTDWQPNDIVTIWGQDKDNQMVSFSAKYAVDKLWKPTTNIPKEWKNTQLTTIAYIPSGTYDTNKDLLIPQMEVNKVVGDFTLSHFYTDVMIGKEEGKEREKVETTLNSPYQQVQLILKNDKAPQEIKAIEIAIEGVLANAQLAQGMWSGQPTTLKINYTDKAVWQGDEADTLFIALPFTEESLKATLTYISDKETKVVEQTLSPKSTTPTPLLFSFPLKEIVNPPLAFSIPIDKAYWKQANQKAMELLKANRGEDYDEATARKYGWVISRPLTDELMHTKTIYTDDVNILGYRVEMNEWQPLKGRDWGVMMGLETMDGTLVEVYLPLYFSTMGGYMPSHNGGYNGFVDNYCYVTVPPGKYRIVCFIKWHKEYVGEEMSKEWHKLPPLDSRTYDEIIRSNRGKHLLYDPIPMHKSPYLGIDEIEVIDRATANNVAPRWRMGLTFQNWEDFRNNQPSYDDYSAKVFRKLQKGVILQGTMVNTSNNTLRGTIVAKCEYLPMFNPIGKWRFEMFAYADNKFDTSWSHEVGRTEVTLSPNSETNVQVEMIDYSGWWYQEGDCGTQELGPKTYIHFYWRDENGNETLMHRVDYEYMNKAQKDNFGDPMTNYNAKYEGDEWYRNIKWREYKVGYGPAEAWHVPNANGFKAW